MQKIDDAVSLPLLFHLNSEPWMNFAAYSDPAHRQEFKRVAGAAVSLPPSRAVSWLARLVRQRSSCRTFAGGSMPIAVLAALLDTTYGVFDAERGPDGEVYSRRPVPSAGSLYPLEFYAALQKVEEVADGLYHYNALHHRLERMPGAGPSAVSAHFLQPSLLEDANAVILIGAVLTRTLAKYGPRGYRYILFEAGHAAQTLCLGAAEAGFGAVCVGGFRDGGLNEALDLDGRHEAILYAVAIGQQCSPDDR